MPTIAVYHLALELRTLLMTTTRQWDIFCRVIDNFGDIGVCWRLSCALAARAQQVRLWVDDASALAWIAPSGHTGVQVLAWTPDAPDPRAHAIGDVVIEAFGCEIDAAWIAPDSIATNEYSMRAEGHFCLKKKLPPVWINLEYLSAESYVERCHALPSPIMYGPAQGLIKWFFYPGFTARTGGLIREPLMHALPRPHDATVSRRISLFCYEPPVLGVWLEQLRSSTERTELLVTAGRAQAAVRLALQVRQGKNDPLPASSIDSSLSIQELSQTTQKGYDALLMGCDLNFVRGEDSLVRALWAGQALVWHIYPQSDGAHLPKLQAFLDWLQAPDDLRAFHGIWNGAQSGDLPELTRERLARWRTTIQAARQRLWAQTDLVTQLIDFVEEKASRA